MVSNIVYSCVSDSLLKKQMGLLRTFTMALELNERAGGKEITQLGYPDSERGLDISIKLCERCQSFAFVVRVQI